LIGFSNTRNQSGRERRDGPSGTKGPFMCNTNKNNYCPLYITSSALAVIADRNAYDVRYSYRPFPEITESAWIFTY